MKFYAYTLTNRFFNCGSSWQRLADTWAHVLHDAAYVGSLIDSLQLSSLQAKLYDFSSWYEIRLPIIGSQSHNENVHHYQYCGFITKQVTSG